MTRLLAGLARQLDLPLFDERGDEQGKGGVGRTARTSDPADPRRDARARRVVLGGGRVLDYAFRRGRRKTIGFTITAKGLAIAAPRWIGMAQVEDAIREREAWVVAKLAEMRRHDAAIPRVAWRDGATLPYLGQPITMRVASTSGPTKRRVGGTTFDRDERTLTLALPPEATETQWRECVEAWLQGEARALFKERLAHFEGRLGVRHRSLRLSSAKTRWGSCSVDGRILLNWRLIHFPLSSIDYVVAHELAHLKEMNHGPRFWATVAALLPDYERAREQVRNPPLELTPRL